MEVMQQNADVFQLLQTLDLGGNFGTPSQLPPNLATLAPNLTLFACDGCNLRGSIPAGDPHNSQTAFTIDAQVAHLQA